ncbi:PREDICTED: protein lifeguard 1-like [Rhagoletis zephyria]|uniref:protein lifeguard 1-like n=1 Tax=Rhagoletis zephyria TaxID=28612 RepID=UPI00081178C0|nr:PREDICTED: protein lifeguard 1-like [Rhagoletis zephyria]
MYNSAETGTYGQDGFDAFSSKTVRLALTHFAKLENTCSIFIITVMVLVVTIIMLTCCENFRRKTPHNYVALMVFTFAESFMVGVISSMYYYKIVLTAVLITAVICLALTIFAFQTKIDFTVYNGLLFVLLIVLMLFGLIASFWRDGIVHLIYSCLGALLFSAYLVVDTQMIVGGTHKFQISSEEYVFAALTLYLDVINIFLYVLSIISSANRS